MNSLQLVDLVYIFDFTLKKALSSHDISKVIVVKETSTCTAYALAKTHKLLFISSDINISLPFELLYLDI